MRLYQEFWARLDRWGRGLPGWTSARAINTCTVVHGYIEGETDRHGRFRPGLGRPRDEDMLFFLLAETAWIYALDAVLDSGPPPDLFRVEILRGMTSGASGSPVEHAGAALANLLPPGSVSADLRQRWLDLAIQAVDAWLVEAKLSQETASVSYQEYITISEQSIAIANHLTTIAIAYEVAPLLMPSPLANRLVHHLAISERLRNDLASVERERREGTRANAVILLGDAMGERSARSFVARELERYESLVEQDAEALGDELTRRAVRVVMASADALYRVRSTEYPASPAADP